MRHKHWNVCRIQGVSQVRFYGLLFDKRRDDLGYLDKLITDLALNSRYVFEDRLLHCLALLAFLHRYVVHTESQRAQLIPNCTDILGVFLDSRHHLFLLALDHSLDLP